MLLSETELRAALEPLLDRIVTERLRYFQLQLEPRLQAIIATALRPAAEAESERAWQRLLHANSPHACFEALFELSAALVGADRALIVIHQGRAAVWRQQGLALPARTSKAELDLLLRSGQTTPIQVRGRVVGVLHWPGPPIQSTDQSRLDLLLATAGLLLLSLAMPAPQIPSAPASAATLARAQPQALIEMLPPLDEDRAQRFARLLIEDLALYLRRERPSELADGERLSDWPRRFQAEIERCRGAFADRFPPAQGTSPAVFEEAVPRLVAP
ncbi:MAG: hypothetical protein ACRD1E_08750 [Terriglobales bacterium]